MRKRIKQYISKWEKMGYPDGIPDEVPHELMKSNLAPSYKSIAMAILSNDNNLKSLGFSSKKSKWYGYLKRIEISAREKEGYQLKMFEIF